MDKDKGWVRVAVVRVAVKGGVRVRVGVGVGVGAGAGAGVGLTFCSDDVRARGRSPPSPALFFSGEEDAG